ncbi:hypothetical protein C8F04DRAFT_1187942 [Mycena alexandri]|uniref:Uncharacterized protein n=1 Tax=Mycena alexandri TaxID=1745969 RepID=A0AAD6SK96_9AGAR|nr:hypothetical protein C8F04DRAFT_1187942 [Mycena alexandri]
MATYTTTTQHGSPLFYSHHAIRRWMTHSEDSPMGPPAPNDTPQYIEDNNGSGQYFQREARSRWAGDLPPPTFVFGIHALIPRFNGFGIVENYTGDNPVHTSGPSTSQHRGIATPPAERGPGSLYSQGRRSASTTTSSSEDSRRVDGTFGHEDELRHRAIASRDRDRFSDEPYWDNRQRARADNRRHLYNNYDGAHGRGWNVSSAENTQNRTPRGQPPPPPTLREARSRAPEPIQTLDNPDLSLAPRGPDGHPQSEWAIRQANSTTIEHNDCPPSDPRYPELEEERIARVRERPLAAGNISQPAWREGNPRLLGGFYRLQIHTIEQAFNLISFLDVGQQEVYELYTLIVGNLAAYPRTFRTEGEAHLMRFQQEIDRAWWITTTGVTRPPRHERHPNLYKTSRGLIHGNARDSSRVDIVSSLGTTQPGTAAGAHRTYGPQAIVGAATSDNMGGQAYGPNYSFGTTAMIRPAQSTTAIVTRSAAPSVVTDASPSYLGGSPPDTEDERPLDAAEADSTARVNTRWTARELELRYQRTYPSVWARGIRSTNGHLATTLGDSPWVPDILAQNTNAALAPGGRRTNTHQQRLFIQAGMQLFFVIGLYEHILRLGEYKLTALPIAHYPYPTDNITIFLVAADVTYLEDYARARRNVTVGIADLANGDWAADAINATALQLTAAQVPHWSVLQHAPGEPAGINVSMHAQPMDGVEGNGDVQTTPPLDTDPDAPTEVNSPKAGEE